MEKKKTKLTLSGNLKKSISNIEKAKTQGKNSVFIEKKSNKFSPKKQFNNNSKFSFKPKSPNFSNPAPPPNDYEKRKPKSGSGDNGWEKKGASAEGQHSHIKKWKWKRGQNQNGRKWKGGKKILELSDRIQSMKKWK